MDALFQQVVQTTKLARTEPIQILDNDHSKLEMLEKHLNEVFELITDKYDENIISAAGRGANTAVLCIYDTNARYRGIVPIHDLLIPPPHLKDLMQEGNLDNLTDRLQKKFIPFKIYIKNICDIKLDWRLAVEPINRTNMYAVIVEWDIDTPELVANASE